MTREEAIQALKKEKKTALHENKVAFDMAIKALDQEHCEELFDDWHEAPSYAMTLEQAREAVHELRKEAVNLRREASEWQQDHAILKAHSDGANEVIDRIREAREELNEKIRVCISLGGIERANGLKTARAILDKLIAEVEGKE